MATARDKIVVFKYIPELDCFVVDETYRRIVDYLGLNEWNHVVWIGRLFTLDNDYGEHWFDNWDERAAIEGKAFELGYDSNDLLIIVPDRLQNGKDGPCHTDDFRRRFWTEVLSSLTLSLELIFAEARLLNAALLKNGVPDCIENLDERIEAVLAGKIPTR